MKKLLIILIVFPVMLIGQNKKINFYSDYQFDKTYDGTKVEGYKKATIKFSDPKLLTKKDMPFDELPKGFAIFRFDGLDEVKETIIYIGKNESNDDIYAITNTETGNDIIYVIKEIHKVGKKTYSHTILLGKSDENNIGGLPKYFTAFHCNIVK
jgi:hypothetical protein